MSEVAFYTCQEISKPIAEPFVKQYHYSHKCPNSAHYFGLFRENIMIGVAVYGYPAMRHQASCYQCDIELRRLCLIDDTPRNAESKFISLSLKQLKLMGYKAVLSLADPEHGHQGTIYKASNFEYLGEERGGGSRLLIIDGKEIHSRSAFAKFGMSGVKNLTELLGADRIQGRDKKRKHVYRYKLIKEVK